MTDWPVAHAKCPRCGGQVELEAGDPLLKCGFCRTGLFLRARGPLRYHLRPVEDAPRRLVYYPFWRFRGLRYRLDPAKGVTGALLDATVSGRDDVLPAANLGIRPQVMDLWLGDPEVGRAVPTTRTPGDAAKLAESRMDGVLGSTGVTLTRFVGETVALVYAPYALEGSEGGWALREVLPDGVRHPLSEKEVRAVHRALKAPMSPQRPSVLPLRCPECSDDLPAAPGSVAFWCDRCGRGWMPGGVRLVSLPFDVVPTSETGVRYFPFWVLTFHARGLPFDNRSDQRRWAVSYQPVPEGWARQAATVWVPAFKVQPRLFLRVARNLTLADLPVGRETRLPRGGAPVEPARLPLSEAAQAVKMVLAELVRGQGTKAGEIPGARLRVRKARIVLLPFQRRGAEWVELSSGTAVHGAAVGLGRNL